MSFAETAIEISHQLIKKDNYSVIEKYDSVQDNVDTTQQLCRQVLDAESIDPHITTSINVEDLIQLIELLGSPENASAMFQRLEEAKNIFREHENLKNEFQQTIDMKDKQLTQYEQSIQQKDELIAKYEMQLKKVLFQGIDMTWQANYFMQVSEDSLTACRLDSTGHKSIYSSETFPISGKHSVQFRIPPYKTNSYVYIGISSQNDQLEGQANGPECWTYKAHGGYKCHNNKSEQYGSSFTNEDIITMELDMNAKTLSFSKNNQSQGVAFTNLPDCRFYVVASLGSSKEAIQIVPPEY